MNKILVVVFDNETAADAGVHAMHELHTEGGITLYAMTVLAKDANGKLSVKQASDQGPTGTGIGLAVGCLVGLLGGPVGVAVGALTGTLVGAARDFWMAGVGTDFVEQAEKSLLPGKVALIAEVEEEWVIPVDSRMEAAGGVVFRRARADLIEAEYDRDLATLNSEIASLEDEVKHATGQAKTRLQAKAAAAKATLDAALLRAKHSAEALKREADGKIDSIKQQLAKTEGEVKVKLEARMQSIRAAYATRSAKLGKAWGLTKEALAA